MIEGKYRYYAFISYKREDEQWAKWLQHKLEHYKLPTNLNGRSDLPKEVRPVFKDTSELMPGNLPEQIREALELSKYLIVLCSPNSAKSEWVNKEVEEFMSMGRTNNIIPFIIDGIPFSSNHDEECFPKAILSLPPDQELLGANINEMGRDAAAVKTVARMFDIRFDELWQRHEREQKRRRNIIISAVAAFVLAVIGVAFWMYLQRQETLRANWEMMENQALMVAEKSKDEVKKGNTYDAILALLEMMPQDGSRPYVPELEEALRVAYDTLQSKRWNSRFIGEQYDYTYLSSDGKRIVGTHESSVNIYDAHSLRKLSEIALAEGQQELMSYLSSANDTLYLLDSTYVMSYLIPNGTLTKKVPYSESVLNQCMKNCHQRLGFYANLQWLDEWKKSVGLSSEVEIIDYNPIRHILLIGQTQLVDDNPWLYYIYDCQSKKIVKDIDPIVEAEYDWNHITTASFSPDGSKLAVALASGGGFVMDLNDYTTTPFVCNGDCMHWSNWLHYGYNGQLLHGSEFAYTEIYNPISLSLVDSINKCYHAEMDQSGNICLMGSEVFYRNKQDRIHATGGSFKLLDGGYIEDTIINKRFHINCSSTKLHFVDLKGENKEWSIVVKNDIEAFSIQGFFLDNKYMTIFRHGARGTQWGVDVINVVSGKVVKRLEPDFYVGSISYNKELEQLLLENQDEPNSDCVIDFPSFDHLVSLCRKATDGMVLSNDARRKFYLNKTK